MNRHNHRKDLQVLFFISQYLQEKGGVNCLRWVTKNVVPFIEFILMILGYTSSWNMFSPRVILEPFFIVFGISM